MDDEHYEALDAYRRKHGRKWKERLIAAWLNDWSEQWGVLRAVRNDPRYHGGKGCLGILECFEKDRRKRNISKNNSTKEKS